MTPVNLTKGAAWEYRVRRAIFASGWYVRGGVNLHERILGAPQTMAEVDALGISWDIGLRTVTLLCECKDRKGSTKEADRIVWLAGLGRVVPASHLVFAKTRVSPATIQFSRSTTVSVWDEAAVQRVEQRFGLSEADWYGAFDPDLMEVSVRAALNREQVASPLLREAQEWVRNAFWYQSTPARLKRLHSYFEIVDAETRSGSSTRTVLLAEGLLGLIACGHTTAGELIRASPMVGRALQLEALAAGVASAQSLRDIAARADEYYRDIFERYADSVGASRRAFTAPRLVEHIAKPPDWASSYLSFAERLTERPEVATDTMRFAELELYERFVAGRDPGPAHLAFVRTDPHYFRVVLSLAAAFCQRVWAIRDPLFERLARGENSPASAGGSALAETKGAEGPQPAAGTGGATAPTEAAGGLSTASGHGEPVTRGVQQESLLGDSQRESAEGAGS